MPKVTLESIASGVAATTVINSNNDAIEEALDNTLSRNGALPNSMNAQIDMDSNRVINVGTPTDNGDAVTKSYADALAFTAGGDVDAYSEQLASVSDRALGSSLVGNTPLPDDTYGRVLQSYFDSRPGVDVLDFIPTAYHAAILAFTSAIDLTTYIQNAINYTATARKTRLIFPAGLFNFSRLYFMYDAVLNPEFPSGNSLQGRITVSGAGRGDHLNLPASGTRVGTVLVSSATTGDCLIAEKDASPYPLKRFVLEDFTVESATSGTAVSTKGMFKGRLSRLVISNTHASGSGLLVKNYDSSIFEDILIIGNTTTYSTGRGLYAYNQDIDGSLSKFSKVLVRGFTTGYEFGLVASTGEFSKFNSLTNCATTDCDVGVIVGDRVESFEFNACQFRGRNYGARTRGRNKYNTFRNTVFNIFGSSSPVACFGIGQGADATTATTRQTDDLLLDNCQFTGITTGVSGVKWVNSSLVRNIELRKPHFEGDGNGTGITFDGAPTSGSIINPVFDNVATEISGTYEGAINVIIEDDCNYLGRTVEFENIAVASATDITYVTTGNVWRITGAVTVNTITTPTRGSPILVLHFASTPTVNDASTSSGNIHLAGSVDFVASADDTLTLAYDRIGSRWLEVCRSVN